MTVENVMTDLKNLFHTVNTLHSDEIEPNSCDDSEQLRILRVLDNPKEVMKGREKELKSLKEVVS